MKPIRILIVDDHRLLLQGLETLVRSQNDWELTGMASQGEEALRMLKAQQADLVLTDIDMPFMNGIELTEAVKAQFPDTKVIIISMHEEKGLILHAMEAGADGYLVKNADKKEFITAIQRVMEGHSYFSEEVTLALLDRKKSKPLSPLQNTLLDKLTGREVEILKLIAEGFSNSEIGEKLFISPRTVDTHRANLMRKLEVNNLAGLIRVGLKAGLIS